MSDRQLSMLPQVKCKRCPALIDCPDNDNPPTWCPDCDAHLEKSHKRFDRPSTPQTLWNHAAGWRIEELSDIGLVKCYQWAKFTNALLRYHSYQFYFWTTSQHQALVQAGGEDHILLLWAEIEKRQITDDAENYSIDFAAIRHWIDRSKRV